MDDTLSDRCASSRRGFVKTSDGFRIHYWLCEAHHKEPVKTERAPDVENKGQNGVRIPEEHIIMIPGRAAGNIGRYPSVVCDSLPL